ncbi:MAG: LLM class F420-dependent oxidoreductase [Rhodococcus fascians]|uniref:LLM class F420-dependent oxidoreductase n=1 Tax=Nocardiaceae TaxID=85025 RepID=UPI000365F290|nr:MULTISPECIES: LLM class F420-dependent oxidoreductase [Rhodococcus]OZC59684.1 LLM class F420-dependent oxidoreductase [Rhodococcus sp. 06-621-2]OZD12150.1 LLM class F420-dependent oxidoreductase [Rhodococcus sp. 06-156-3C]OZD19181.1 LLM class F420-dependent oxidoreductase [Rhodococcus sp. 06-156-4C]OZD20776.1 LLM class F420-dependent oxidoreductase [Rhodococcus sp. 06-156-4a]OZD28952.1 LLM class F420-dependent oxidoreductase [Rhodococcus sp. 06-156-3b]
MTVKIGVQLQPQHAPDYQLIRDAVLRSEDAGVDIVFNWDHFYPLYGDLDGEHFECWTMLGAWAEQTSNVEIGALVTGGGYRNPDLLADMARTVDHISGGRLILGIGAGWNQKDYDNFGYEFGTPGSRLKLLAEYLPRIVDRLKVGNPAPKRDIPILIGGGGEKKTLKLVAQYAHIWHSFADLDELKRKSGILADHGDTVGRDVSSIARSVAWPGADKAQGFVDAGATLFTVGTSGPDYDLTELKEAIAWRNAANDG